MSLADKVCDMGADNAVMIDGYDDAALGVTEDGRIVYSYNRMVEILCVKDGMTVEEAVEYLDYNALRALPYLGDQAPIILYPFEEWE